MLVLHYDVPSLAATVAALRLQAIVDAGGSIAFQGIDVLGVDTVLPATLDQLEELERHGPDAAALGLTVRPPSRRPPTVAAHLLGILASERELGAAWRDAIFRAYWTDGAPLEDHAVLVELAGQVGLDRVEAREVLADPRPRMALRRRMAADRARGIGGVPVLELDGTLVPADLPDADLRQLAGL